jgi:hypothetical protein
MQIGGAPMQVGQRILDCAAKMMSGLFFAAAAVELQAAEVAAVARQGIPINLWRSIVRLVRARLRRG